MGKQPHAPVGAFFNAQYIVIDQRIRIAGLMFEYFEFIAIITVQARCCTKPHKAVGILKNTANAIIGKTIRDIEMRKLVNVFLRIQIGLCDKKQ
jgi:hypothetical protein